METTEKSEANSRQLLNLNPAFLRDAAGLHDDVVVEAAFAAHPRRDLFGGATERDRELLVVALEPFVAQTPEHLDASRVVRAAVVERVPLDLVLRLSHCSSPPFAGRPRSRCNRGLESS